MALAAIVDDIWQELLHETDNGDFGDDEDAGSEDDSDGDHDEDHSDDHSDDHNDDHRNENDGEHETETKSRDNKRGQGFTESEEDDILGRAVKRLRRSS